MRKVSYIRVSTLGSPLDNAQFFRVLFLTRLVCIDVETRTNHRSQQK